MLKLVFQDERATFNDYYKISNKIFENFNNNGKIASIINDITNALYDSADNNSLLSAGMPLRKENLSMTEIMYADNVLLDDGAHLEDIIHNAYYNKMESCFNRMMLRTLIFDDIDFRNESRHFGILIDQTQATYDAAVDKNITFITLFKDRVTNVGKYQDTALAALMSYIDTILMIYLKENLDTISIDREVDIIEMEDDENKLCFDNIIHLPLNDDPSMLIFVFNYVNSIYQLLFKTNKFFDATKDTINSFNEHWTYIFRYHSDLINSTIGKVLDEFIEAIPGLGFSGKYVEDFINEYYGKYIEGLKQTGRVLW